MTLTATVADRISSSSRVLIWDEEAVDLLASGVFFSDIINAACAGICGWIDWDWDEDGNIVRV